MTIHAFIHGTNKVSNSNDTYREKLCFTQFSARTTAWLLLTFFISLRNQLSSTHSITRIKSTNVLKMSFLK